MVTPNDQVTTPAARLWSTSGGRVGATQPTAEQPGMGQRPCAADCEAVRDAQSTRRQRQRRERCRKALSQPIGPPTGDLVGFPLEYPAFGQRQAMTPTGKVRRRASPASNIRICREVRGHRPSGHAANRSGEVPQRAFSKNAQDWSKPSARS
jgi:hypothetical protein